ncbi:putative sporulation protein YtxC [Shouchella clausii]|uniref:putative sporulation protein YtxC n=1 Tax=Shouchella clausii TaxID=79880 RepID=UPI000BA7E1AB|nr:putative sporulation protein YtxC [Shouchella clausii]PAE93481.1 hypothetical protein CHH70_12320 [Shouchella clausii]
MIAIHFEERGNCSRLFDELRGYMATYKPYGFGGAVEKNSEATITVRYENKDVDFYESFHPFLASIFAEYVIETKEDEWLMDIAENLFYFTDEEEKQQIVAIAQAILQGDRKDIPSVKPHFDRRAFLYDAFASHLNPDTTFYYEPFLTFRLKEYGEMLIDCIELAIDEYLMEQDYQAMVENLRHYIRITPARLPMVYLVHKDMFTFYDEHFRELTAEEMAYYLKQELVFETGLDFSEMVISPLVSMAPGHVHVFTDEPDHGVILTIQAIFQERLTIFPLQERH